MSIYPSDNTNDYETTTENERTFAWKVLIAYDTKSENKTGMQSAFDAMKPLVDDVVDKIDQENKLSAGQTIGIDMPAKYTFLTIWAVPGVWGITEQEQLLVVELAVRILVSVDITT